MKKTLVAIAALSAISAFAQSSVTLGGTVDVRLAIGNGDTSNVTALRSSGINSSHFRFVGVEDLGGGLKAGFHLEAGYNVDDGTGLPSTLNNQTITAFSPATGSNASVRAGTQGFTFNRRSTLSVMGGFGEVRLGRDYTPHFWNHTYYDPFGTNGVGSTMTLTGSLGTMGSNTVVRASNALSYFTPNFGGFSAQIQTYLGENSSGSLPVPTAAAAAANATALASPTVANIAAANAANAAVTAALASNAAGPNAGSGSSLRVGYVQGPINVGLAYARTNTSGNVDSTHTNIGGSYDLGILKIMGAYTIDANTGAPDVRGALIGVTAPLGSGTAKAAFSQTDNGRDGVAKQFALGYVYDLSKRSAVYATVATINNSNTSFALNGATTTRGGNSTGFDLGVRHSF